MISITIGLLLLAGITTLIAQQSSARAEIDKSGRQIENGRYALTLLQDDIQHAGFYGQYSGAITTLAALPDPCATDLATIDASLAMPLQGYDAPTTVPAPLSACLLDANHIAGTDILVVRRLEATDTLTTIAGAVAGQVYVQTTPDGKVTGSGSDTTVFTLTQKDATTAAELRKYVEHIYFLSPCNVYATGATSCTSAADGGSPVPTLKRLEITSTAGTTAFTTTPLVDGIQNMQFDYGIDSALLGPTDTGTPNFPFVTAPGITDWPNVMAVQVNLLARNVDPSVGYIDTKTYNLGVAGTVGPFSDAYKRHAYTAAVRAVNPSGRRE
ncbi:PilW family protein [Glaciimonas immobilis]|uniref:Type IV pilus assembly protein PilW n=1 Tax=Glaciimonas immobilis TaxID=728004 RepID=A0A840RRF5_9BURK|nr:PilW family protein [Glaciimonas immobilis]MBB5199568.1 type IV pilus assembly protein PilW [Glaciimonas immobilis]